MQSNIQYLIFLCFQSYTLFPVHQQEEQKAADDWERKTAYALVSHEFGLLFEALADGIKSKNIELSSNCFLLATWLIHMLMALPDTGLRGAARVCLLKRFVLILKSSKDIEDRVLSMLSLSSFIRDPGMHIQVKFTATLWLPIFSTLPSHFSSQWLSLVSAIQKGCGI